VVWLRISLFWDMMLYHFVVCSSEVYLSILTLKMRTEFCLEISEFDFRVT
jgi:hypothetical protein